MRKQVLFVRSFVGIIVVLISSAAQIWAAPGDLDTGFGILGQVYDSSMVGIRGTAVQADGKIVAVGTKDFKAAVVRYNVDGSIDYSFGTQGRVFGDTEYGIFYSVVVQDDGKIVAAGRTDGNAFVIRLDSNGNFDTSFSVDGKLSIVFARGFDSSELTTVAIDPNSHKIVVAGTIFYDANDYPCVQGSDIVFARLNSNGTFDISLNGNGKQSLDLACRDVLTSMAIHPSNSKIAFTTEGNGDFQVGMLNSNGSFDTSFGGTGVVETDFNGTSYQHDRAEAVAFQRWQTNIGGYPMYMTRLVVGGTAYGSSVTVYDSALARYRLDGSLDTAFDGDGKVRKALTYQFDSIDAIKIDSQQRIVTTGPRGWNNKYDFSVVRFTRDGDYDATFGTGGKVSTPFYFNNERTSARPYDVAIAPDGKIVAAGSGTYIDSIMARYEP